jgi:hypothetical protein
LGDLLCTNIKLAICTQIGYNRTQNEYGA